jgi:hypothetical protein
MHAKNSLPSREAVESLEDESGKLVGEAKNKEAKSKWLSGKSLDENKPLGAKDES